MVRILFAPAVSQAAVPALKLPAIGRLGLDR